MFLQHNNALIDSERGKINAWSHFNDNKGGTLWNHGSLQKCRTNCNRCGAQWGSMVFDHETVMLD